MPLALPRDGKPPPRRGRRLNKAKAPAAKAEALISFGAFGATGPQPDQLHSATLEETRILRMKPHAARAWRGSLRAGLARCRGLAMTGRGLAQKSIDLIEHSRRILAAIHPTTIRGVAYQLFTRGLIENMGDKCVRNVSRMLVIAREKNHSLGVDR